MLYRVSNSLRCDRTIYNEQMVAVTIPRGQTMVVDLSDIIRDELRGRKDDLLVEEAQEGDVVTKKSGRINMTETPRRASADARNQKAQGQGQGNPEGTGQTEGQGGEKKGSQDGASEEDETRRNRAGWLVEQVDAMEYNDFRKSAQELLTEVGAWPGGTPKKEVIIGLLNDASVKAKQD